MPSSLLSGPRRAPKSGGAPKQLVVFLHGVGSNGDDLISLADEWAGLLPDTAFVSPNGAEAFDMAPFGYQWFSLREYSLPFMRRGADAVLPTVQAFLDAELAAAGLGDDALALVGFSQGTMMSLHAGLRRARSCAGILGYSGALLGTDGVTARPPVCLVHGEEDMVVPFAALPEAERQLTGVRVPVETHARPMLGHGIDGEGLRVGAAFLRRVFGL